MAYKALKKEILKFAKPYGSKTRPDTCMYRSADRKRYCNITSQQNCVGCRFYEPNAETVYKAALDEIKAVKVALLDKEIELAELKTVMMNASGTISAVAEQLYFAGLYVSADRIANSLNDIDQHISGKR